MSPIRAAVPYVDQRITGYYSNAKVANSGPAPKMLPVPQRLVWSPPLVIETSANNSDALLRAVETGESYTVTNRGDQVAPLVPITEQFPDLPLHRRRGSWWIQRAGQALQCNAQH